MAKQKNEIAAAVNNLPAEFAGEWQTVDGGDIPPGWAPQYAKGVSRFSDSETAEKVEKGLIKSLAPMIVGTLDVASAWNKPRYVLRNAVDSDGQKFDVVRLPESSVIYNSARFKKMGAKVRIAWNGWAEVELPNGSKTKAMTFKIDLADTSYQLTSPRPDALRLPSEAERKLLEKIETIREEYDVKVLETQLAGMQRKVAGLLSSGDVLDAEFE